MPLKHFDCDWFCCLFFSFSFCNLIIVLGWRFDISIRTLSKQNTRPVTLCGRSCRSGGGLEAPPGWRQVDYLGRAACRPRSARSACLHPPPAPGRCTAPRPPRCSRRRRSRPTPSTSGSCSGCRGHTPRSAERETSV